MYKPRTTPPPRRPNVWVVTRRNGFAVKVEGRRCVTRRASSRANQKSRPDTTTTGVIDRPR